MLRVSTYFQHCRSCAKGGDSASGVCCKGGVNAQGDMNLALGENSKEPLSSTISAEISFSDDSNEETLKI